MQRDPDDPPLKLTREAFNCLQLVLESLIVMLLGKAAHIVEKTTKGARETVLAQDLYTTLDTLFPNMPMLKASRVE